MLGKVEICGVNTSKLPTLTAAETNALLIDYMTRRGVTDGYWQDVDAATADMIPDFDGTGV